LGIRMFFVLNELSLDGQYLSEGDFKRDLKYIMKARQRYPTFASSLYCSRLLSEQVASRGQSFREIVQKDGNLKRLVLEWINKKGPFFQSGESEVEFFWSMEGDTEVTYSGAGEACRILDSGREASCISFPDGGFNYSPVKVYRDYDPLDSFSVTNHWHLQNIDVLARKTLPNPSSWQELQSYCNQSFINLKISESSFDGAKAHPYSDLLAERITRLLRILDCYVDSLNSDGPHNEISEKIITDHFTGERCLFSDESEQNKKRFKKKLTFRDTDNTGKELFCPWHGKISHGTFRIHFEWPLGEKRKLGIYYIGPKLTKH